MYKNIVFDVGGVLFSYQWTVALSMGGMSMDEAKVLGPKLFDDPMWNQLDLGIRPYMEVVEELASHYPEYHDAIVNFLTDVENMPIGRPVIWEKVHALKEKGYSLYILSNYSDYMFGRHTAGCPFIDEMDGILVSYMVNVIKPDEGIYKALLQRFDLDPSECLFFDDRPENIEGAKKCGIDGIVVTGEDMLAGELDKLLAVK
ncbi:MAG: HAD family phosphatase [Lachnospiraceae bacterium]|nr:HAD family phosphatase [Lachnospiraceae bacterium]